VILSNEGIREALAAGHLKIDPPPGEDQYTTSAVDLTLGRDFREWNPDLFDVPGARVDLNLADQEFHSTARAYLRPCSLEADGAFVLAPYPARRRHVLAITREKVHLDRAARLAARVEGRSSLARLDLIVHLTAPTIHAGFNGNITLEMVNIGPFYLRLVPERTRICQLIVERLESEPSGDIKTQFQGQTQPSGEIAP